MNAAILADKSKGVIFMVLPVLDESPFDSLVTVILFELCLQ
jgi:hypothetical protein